MAKRLFSCAVVCLLLSCILPSTAMAGLMISYHANGSDVTGNPPSQDDLGLANEFLLPGPSAMQRAGYAFGGWYKGSATGGTLYREGQGSGIIFNDLDYYARWLSVACEVESFSVQDQVSSSISGPNISVVMPYGTSLTSLTPTFTVSAGAQATPASGTLVVVNGTGNVLVESAAALDVDSTYNKPASNYANGQTLAQTYTISVTTAPASSDKDITAFNIPGGTTTISGTSITVDMPAGTVLTSLVPTIAVSAGATVSPDSGVAVDFSGGSIAYTVTAADGTTQVYTVTIKLQQSGGGGSSDDWEPVEDIKSYEQAIVIKCREWANVRSGPGTDTDIVGRVYLGESISLLEWNKDETWCKILYDGDSQLGWLYYKFIKPVK